MPDTAPVVPGAVAPSGLVRQGPVPAPCPSRRPGAKRFPVAGAASYSNDWHAPRLVPDPHLHQGTDIFARAGTPVVAPAAGTVRLRTSPVGGITARVVERDGTYWYLAHLAGLAPGVREGQRVRAGTPVGFVGDTGNARGGAPHLHLELHPGGGPAVNPYPVLGPLLVAAAAGDPCAGPVGRRSRPAGTLAGDEPGWIKRMTSFVPPVTADERQRLAGRGSGSLAAARTASVPIDEPSGGWEDTILVLVVSAAALGVAALVRGQPAALRAVVSRPALRRRGSG